MPKKVFWPAALVVMGLVFLAQNMGYLSPQFWNLWPIILIVVGLGGLITSDRDQWLYPEPGEKPVATKTAKKPVKLKRPAKKK